MTKNIEDLEKQIEELVLEHIASLQQAATRAVERAFGAGPKHAGTKQKRAATRATAKPRRTTEEMAAVGEQLYEAVRANPGESMKVLMAEVGRTANELQRPMVVLKRAGRVRSVGERHLTRYFPMAGTR